MSSRVMDNPLILTFDIGTQSIRALLVDKAGRIVDSEQLKYSQPYLSPVNGWAEQTPSFYFERLGEVVNLLKGRASAQFDSIKAVTITCIRDTTLCLDHQLKPLRNIIVWLDERKPSEDIKLPFFKKLLFSVIGMTDSIKMLYKASVCNWLKEKEPAVWENTYKFVLLPTYMNYLLTGELKDSAANMIGHIPFDYKDRCWMKKDLSRCVADIPLEKLVPLVETGDIIGHISEQASKLTGIPQGLPLIATGSDKGCETLGLSVTATNKAAISLGTTATLQFASKEYFEPQPFLPSYPAIIPGMYNAEFQIYRGYWLISWFKREFGAKEESLASSKGCSAEELLDQGLANVPLGCDGLVLLPHFTPGVGNPMAKGALVGLSDVHTRMHIYRAIVEGIDFELYGAMKRMEVRSGQKITELFIGGGGAHSDAVAQIAADVFGLPVKRIQTHEACGLGSSLVAFVSLGVFKDYEAAIESMVHESKVFVPDYDAHNSYMEIYENVYKNLEKKLTPSFRKIRHFIEKSGR